MTQGAQFPLESKHEAQQDRESTFAELFPAPGGKVDYAKGPDSAMMALFPPSNELLGEMFFSEKVGRRPFKVGDETPAVFQNISDRGAAESLGKAEQQHSFSAQDIENSGKVTAQELLSKDMGSGEANYEILKQDNAQQLTEDVNAYAKSGGMGGVQQGQLNDCWFQSCVVAMASSAEGRQQLSQMIIQGSDGSYTVTFPGDKSNPITVSQDEVNNNRNITDSAEWARVLEAAENKRDPAKVAPDGQGGNVNFGMKLLTGKDVEAIDISATSASELAATITQSLQDGKPVIATSKTDAPEPLVESHAYTVLGYDLQSNTVRLRNPWGYNDIPPGQIENGVSTAGAGLVSMPMDEFMNEFRFVRTSTDAPAVV